MSRDATFFLEDIEIACEKILRFTRQMDFSGFVGDERTYDAVIRNLEIIGEAAKRLPDETSKQISGIEWKKIKGLRDVIVHEYFGIDTEIVWNVVCNKIPELHVVIQEYRRNLQRA
jgi:Uncharacterized conserved protein